MATHGSSATEARQPLTPRGQAPPGTHTPLQARRAMAALSPTISRPASASPRAGDPLPMLSTTGDTDARSMRAHAAPSAGGMRDGSVARPLEREQRPRGVRHDGNIGSQHTGGDMFFLHESSSRFVDVASVVRDDAEPTQIAGGAGSVVRDDAEPTQFAGGAGHDGSPGAASHLLRQFAHADLAGRAQLQGPLLDGLLALSVRDMAHLLLAYALHGDIMGPAAEYRAALLFAEHDCSHLRQRLNDAAEHNGDLQRRLLELQHALDAASDMSNVTVEGAITEHEVYALELRLEQALAQRQRCDAELERMEATAMMQQARHEQHLAGMAASLHEAERLTLDLSAALGATTEDMGELIRDMTVVITPPDDRSFTTPPRTHAEDDEQRSARRTVERHQAPSPVIQTRCSMLAGGEMISVPDAMRRAGAALDIRTNLGTGDQSRWQSAMEHCAQLAEQFGMSAGVCMSVPQVMKAAVREAVLDKLLVSAGRLFPKRTDITSMSDVLHQLRDAFEAIRPARNILVAALGEDNPEAAMIVYGKLYERAQTESNGDDIRAAIAEEQDLLFLVIQRALSRHSAAFQSDLSTREGARGKLPLKELAGMQGLAALIYVREHFFRSKWQQLPDAFAMLSDLGAHFSDMRVDRFHGNFSEFCRHLDDAIDGFEREYGVINSALFKNLQLLQAIFESSHDHIVTFRKLSMEKGHITAQDLNFHDASGKVRDLAVMLRDHELRRPDVDVWDKPPKSAADARRLMHENSSGKGRHQTHLAEVESLKSELLAMDAMKTGIAEAFYGADFKRDAAPKCVQCGFPHAAGGTCLTAELMKRLIDQHGVLMRMMSKTEAAVTRVSQSGGNADKLRPELETVATELARTRNEVIAAVGTPKGRPPFHGAKTSGGSRTCFKWRDTGKCAENDKGTCRFDHPASISTTSQPSACAAPGCGKPRAALPYARFCSLTCHRANTVPKTGPANRRVREEAHVRSLDEEEAHVRELDEVMVDNDGVASYQDMMEQVHAMSGSVYLPASEDQAHEVHLLEDVDPGARDTGDDVGSHDQFADDDVETWWLILEMAMGGEFLRILRSDAALLRAVERPSQTDEQRLECLDLPTPKIDLFLKLRDEYLLNGHAEEPAPGARSLDAENDNDELDAILADALAPRAVPADDELQALLTHARALRANTTAQRRIADHRFEMMLKDEIFQQQDAAALQMRKRARRRRRNTWSRAHRHNYWRVMRHSFAHLRENMRRAPLTRGFHSLYVNWRAKRAWTAAAFNPLPFALAQHARLGAQSPFHGLNSDLVQRIVDVAVISDIPSAFNTAFDNCPLTHDMSIQLWCQAAAWRRRHGIGVHDRDTVARRIWRPRQARSSSPPSASNSAPSMRRTLRHTGKGAHVPRGQASAVRPWAREDAHAPFTPRRSGPQLRRMLWMRQVRDIQREARLAGPPASLHMYLVASSGRQTAAGLRSRLALWTDQSRLSYFMRHHDLHQDTALPPGRRYRTLLHLHRAQRMSNFALDLRNGSIDASIRQVDDTVRGLSDAISILFGSAHNIEYDEEDAPYEQYEAMDDGTLRRLWPPAGPDARNYPTDDTVEQDGLHDLLGMRASSSDQALCCDSDDDVPRPETTCSSLDTTIYAGADSTRKALGRGRRESMPDLTSRRRESVQDWAGASDAEDEFSDSDDAETIELAMRRSRSGDGASVQAQSAADGVHAISVAGALTGRQGSVQGCLHPLSVMARTEPYRMLDYCGERQEYCNLNFDSSDMKRLLHCYKMREHGLHNIILHLVDSGSSCFLSPDSRHFYVRRPCDTSIKGIGKEAVTEYSPLFYSFVTEEGGYVMLQFDRVYSMPTLDFPIFSSGKANDLGFKFLLASDAPHMLTPDGRHVPLIRDHMTGFMWIAERCLADMTVKAQQFAVSHALAFPDLQAQPPLPAPSSACIEALPDAADDKAHVDRMIAATQGHYGGFGADKTGPQSACPANTRSRTGAASASRPNAPSDSTQTSRRRPAPAVPDDDSASSSSDDAADDTAPGISAARRATRALDACDLRVGDIVWVPYNRRLWPAQVSAPQMLRRGSFPAAVAAAQKDDRILIHFFDNWKDVHDKPNRRMYAWATRASMRLFDDWADDAFAEQDKRFAEALSVAADIITADKSSATRARRQRDPMPEYDPDMRVPNISRAPDKAGTPSGSAKPTPSEAHDKGGDDDGAETLLRRLQAMSDDEYMQWIRKHAIKRPKPVRVRLPAMRLVDTGEPTEVQKLKSYVHRLFGHLSDALIWDMIDHVDGADLIKAVLLTRQGNKSVPGPHCDHCAEYKEKLPPRPSGRTTRPTRAERLDKMYFDQSGKIEEASAFHGFHYYNLGLASTGFLFVEGLVHLSQTLFAMAKTYADAGGAPKVTQVDGGGAMTSKTADKFYAARNTKKLVTVHHWQHGKCERRHMVQCMARAMMSAAGAPTSFWYLAVRHAVLVSNVILPARDEKGNKIGGTVWEAHYGVKPRVQDLLLGPWGCLAYLIMTEEQRQKQHKKRGETKHWGVRAISGIYIGSYCDPQTLVFKHLLTDGRSIYASAGQIKVVGDVYPLRLQVARDLALRWGSEDRDSGDDDHEEVVMTAVEHWAVRASLKGDHLQDKLQRGRRQLDRWQTAAHLKAYDDEFDRYAFAAAMEEATQEHQAQVERELAFVAAAEPETAAMMRARANKMDKPAKRPLRVLADKILGRDEGHVPLEELFAPAAKSDCALDPENPLDFDIQEAPPDFVLERPYDSCRYELAVPSDFVSGKTHPLEVIHPHVMKYTGRAVRKSFKQKGRGGHLVDFDCSGKVSSYKEKQGHFEVRFSDGQTEAMDLDQLHEILIMGKKYGDEKPLWGRTRAEVSKTEYVHLIADTIAAELLHDKMPDRVFYDGAPAPSLHAIPMARKWPGGRATWLPRLCRRDSS